MLEVCRYLILMNYLINFINVGSCMITMEWFIFSKYSEDIFDHSKILSFIKNISFQKYWKEATLFSLFCVYLFWVICFIMFSNLQVSKRASWFFHNYLIQLYWISLINISIVAEKLILNKVNLSYRSGWVPWLENFKRKQSYQFAEELYRQRKAIAESKEKMENDWNFGISITLYIVI